MTEKLLLDTHVLLWLDTGSSRLKASTRGVIDRCWQSGGTVIVSAVSVWEIALLADTGRIELDIPVEAWTKRFLDRPGVDLAPFGYRASARSYRFHQLEQRDPADRLLIATAIELACPLVTYDKRIIEFGTRHRWQYGFTADA